MEGRCGRGGEGQRKRRRGRAEEVGSVLVDGKNVRGEGEDVNGRGTMDAEREGLERMKCIVDA